ncbi:hypothetical protein H072_5195 [Dactylellina haptotyla CBS 200.50]|uniref:Uncharacterized protein n=1 Tax=Dactylellina haptotyla (strain CBS 200.50) TaxID=1284197 RepID=S8ADC4_DACHA|nr:hypothetical protein H072_5195 [Dactylellina haptotyla CBS 200.50]
MHLKYFYLTAICLTANAAPTPLGLDIISGLLKDDNTLKDIKIANGGPVGPGLSELVAVAEGILKKYGITKTYADIMDLDAGTLKIVADILGVNGKEGIIAGPGKLLGNSPPKNSKLDASGQKVLPTDIYKPTLPASEQDGIKFHNIDVVSFLPGVVDETWIVAFGGKETHFGTNKACFSLSGSNLQISPDSIKARCLTKDISGENKGSPEEEKKPLKEEKCPPLAIAGVAGGKVITKFSKLKAEKVEKITACWGSLPAELTNPTPVNRQESNPKPSLVTSPEPMAPKYAILKFNGVLVQE